jgi:hypothetical protein
VKIRHSAIVWDVSEFFGRSDIELAGAAFQTILKSGAPPKPGLISRLVPGLNYTWLLVAFAGTSGTDMTAAGSSRQIAEEGR